MAQYTVHHGVTGLPVGKSYRTKAQAEKAARTASLTGRTTYLINFASGPYSHEIAAPSGSIIAYAYQGELTAA